MPIIHLILTFPKNNIHNAVSQTLYGIISSNNGKCLSDSPNATINTLLVFTMCMRFSTSIHTLEITMNKYLQNNILYCSVWSTHRAMFRNDAHGTTAVYRTRFWHRILIEFKLVSCENLCVQNYGKNKFFSFSFRACTFGEKGRHKRQLHFSTNNIPLLQQ